MNKEDLLKLAQSTEKARVLIDEGNSKCSSCEYIIDECICDRCSKCFNITDKCECYNTSKNMKKIILIKYFISKDEDEINIQILSMKIKLKIFILEN